MSLWRLSIFVEMAMTTSGRIVMKRIGMNKVDIFLGFHWCNFMKSFSWGASVLHTVSSVVHSTWLYSRHYLCSADWQECLKKLKTLWLTTKLWLCWQSYRLFMSLLVVNIFSDWQWFKSSLSTTHIQTWLTEIGPAKVSFPVERISLCVMSVMCYIYCTLSLGQWQWWVLQMFRAGSGSGSGSPRITA